MGKKRIILSSSLDCLAPLLGRYGVDLQVDHLSSQDSIDRVVQAHLICLAPLFPIQLAVDLVLSADGPIEFLSALRRGGVNGLSDALLQTFLLVLAESEYLGLGHHFLLDIASDGQIKLLPPQQGLILGEVVCVFGEFGIWFREFAIGAIEVFIGLVAVLAGFFVFVDGDFVLMRAVEDAE